MALPIRKALRSAGRYLFRNPRTLARVARHAVGMRVAVPLDALRWFVTHTPPGMRSPTDVTITAKPPAIAVGASIVLMGTKLRASAAIKVDELRVNGDEVRLSLRLSDVDLAVLGNSQSAVA